MASVWRCIGAAFISGALLGGCAANGSATPPVSNAVSHASHSLMLPQARADNLLYVADQINGIIVYTYPPDGYGATSSDTT